MGEPSERLASPTRVLIAGAAVLVLVVAYFGWARGSNRAEPGESSGESSTESSGGAAPESGSASESEGPTEAEAPSGQPTLQEARAQMQAELRSLTAVRTALVSDPEEALRLADEGHRRFPGGAFHEEREAIALRALSRLGRPTAERAERFFERYPESRFGATIRRDLGDDAP